MPPPETLSNYLNQHRAITDQLNHSPPPTPEHLLTLIEAQLQVEHTVYRLIAANLTSHLIHTRCLYHILAAACQFTPPAIEQLFFAYNRLPKGLGIEDVLTNETDH